MTNLSNEVKQDNTRVSRPFKPLKFKLTQKLKDNIKKLLMSKRTLPLLYDKDKADYYRNMLNIVNSSFFGAGFNSGLYRNNPMTEQGQRAIESSFNYAKTNAAEFLSNVAGIGAQGAARNSTRVYSKFTKSPFKKTGGDLGKMSKYTKNGIVGEGAEAVVVKNTPTTVAKFTDIPISEMALRDAVANTIKHNYIGYVTKGKTKLPTYVLLKVKVLTEKTFPKHVKKLDKSMEKNGFKRVKDPNVYGRAYTDSRIVIDDIAEGNVGLTSGNPWLDKILPDWMKSPKIIDMAYLTVPEWRAMGYKLLKGGKVLQRRNKINNSFNFIKSYYNSPGFNLRFHNLPNSIFDEFNLSLYDPFSDLPLKVLIKYPMLLKRIIFSPKESARYNSDKKEIVIGSNDVITDSIGYWGADDTVAHELGHAIDKSILFKAKDGSTYFTNGIYSSILEIIKKKYQRITNKLDDRSNFDLFPELFYKYAHDAMPSESYADLMALRYKLYKLGIYDSRKLDSPFTLKHLNLFKKSNSNFRLLLNFDDKDIIEMMNTVAQHNINSDLNNLYKA